MLALSRHDPSDLVWKLLIRAPERFVAGWPHTLFLLLLYALLGIAMQKVGIFKEWVDRKELCLLSMCLHAKLVVLLQLPFACPTLFIRLLQKRFHDFPVIRDHLGFALLCVRQVHLAEAPDALISPFAPDTVQDFKVGLDFIFALARVDKLLRLWLLIGRITIDKHLRQGNLFIDDLKSDISVVTQFPEGLAEE